MFMGEIGLQFFFLVESVCGFGIRVTLASQKEFGNVSPVSSM